MGLFTLCLSGAALGLCVVILICAALAPRAITHPSNILIYKILCDAMICLNYVWSSAMLLTSYASEEEICKPFCYVGDFFQKSSILLFIVLNWDLWNAMRNPFTVHREYYFRYFAFVVLLAIGCIIVALIAQCSWFCSSNNCTSTVNKDIDQGKEFVLIAFPVVTIIAVLFSIYVWYRIRTLIRGGLPQTSATRRSILFQGESFVHVLGTCYCLLSVKFLLDIFFTSFITNYTDSTLADVFEYLELVFFTLVVVGDVYALSRTTGLFSVLSRQLRHRALSSSINEDRHLLEVPIGADVTLTSVLQQEIVLCISFGVFRSLRVQSEHEYSVALPPVYNRSFGFVDVLPKQFSKLRALYNLDDTAYAASFLMPDDSSQRLAMLGSFSEGKSGSFMYFTSDKRYIVKTLTAKELAVFKSNFDTYYEHFRRNPTSLIVKFYGMHAVRLSPEQRLLYFVIMERVGGEYIDLSVSRMFDLKGSTADRTVGNATNITQKDMDLPILHGMICVGPETKRLLCDAIRSDTAMLESCNVMDYSVLTLVHHCNAHRVICPAKHNCPYGAGYLCPNGAKCPMGGGIGLPHAELRERVTCPAGDRCALVAMRNCPTGDECPSLQPCKAGHRCSAGPLCPERHLCGHVDCPCSRECNAPNCPRGMCRHGHPGQGRVRSDVLRTAQPGYNDEMPPYIYIFRIIDILQRYDLGKVVERLYKRRIRMLDGREISASPPDQYARRFRDRLADYMS